MVNSKLLLGLGIVLISFNSFSQRTSDIGFQISTIDDARMLIEFRKPVLEKWTFNIGGSYGRSGSFPGYKTITGATDTTVTQRNFSHWSNMGTLRVGMERQFKTSMFSCAADFVLGYTNVHKTNSDLVTELDSTGNWTAQSFYTYPYFGSQNPTYAQVKRHYLTPGIQLSLRMDVPIGNRFFLNVFVAGLASTDILLRETNVIDPYNEFAGGNFFSINFQASAGLGLRYRFGQGKKKKE